MDFQNIVRSRRAVKHYDANFIMPEKDFVEIIELARHSPSSFNIQHWRIVNVTDKNLRRQIQNVAWGQTQITEASSLLILCADLNADEKHPERYWETASPEVQKLMTSMIYDFYHNKEQLKRDEALRSIGIIAQTIMLSSKALGYDSCPMIGFDTQAVSGLIHLPEDYIIGMMITIGKALSPARPKGGYIPLEDMVIQNKF